MIFVYQIFIFFYQFVISIAALRNVKAKQWKDGRKNLFQGLQKHFPAAAPVIWVHAASAGEFEQAKPVIERLKESFPDHKVLVSFFSPSGYAQGKKWKGADFVCYLPADTRKNAARFVQLVQPRLVIFVKYDFWYHHLKAVHEQRIPLLLVAALFRERQVFFRWYGTLHRSMLHFFTHLFVQEEASADLLQKHGFAHCSAAGDPRFDRVAAIAANRQPVDFIDAFKAGKPLLVAGSTWPDDEKMLLHATAAVPEMKLVIAPHEIHAAHIAQIEQVFSDTLRYSQLQEPNKSDPKEALLQAKVLLIDNVGMLSRLYRHGDIAYIGGGFNKSGIHNTLEAAVYGKPVLFGPNYQKFREAKDLVACGAGFSYETKQQLANQLQQLLQDRQHLQASGNAAAAYVQENKGAAQRILGFIQEKRLLTN